MKLFKIFGEYNYPVICIRKILYHHWDYYMQNRRGIFT